MEQSTRHPFEDVLDKTEENTDEGDVSVGAVVDAFGDRTFGPVLTVLGLLVISPLGAIPGFPFVVSITVVLISGQKVVGKSQIWLPKTLRDRHVSKDKLKSGIERFRPWLARMDRVIRPRLSWATSDVPRWAAAVVSMVLGALITPLGFIPFAVALPGAAILMIGVAMTARDGIVMLIALPVAALTVYYSMDWLL